MIPQWKQALFEDIKNSLVKDNRITFVHTPKTGGTYVRNVIQKINSADIAQHLTISYKSHVKTLPNRVDGITFTVIRDPVSRLESVLNHRLTTELDGRAVRFHTTPPWVWPPGVDSTQKAPVLTLDMIVDKIEDGNIDDPLNIGWGYWTLCHYAENVDLLLTINEVTPFLEMLGVTRVPTIGVVNKSQRLWGTLSKKTQQRIKQLYYKDVELYNHWTRKDDEKNNE